jgi:uncharacterized protein YecE (DUF72 family)
MAAKIYIACAGWNVPGAQQAHFPSDGSHLERYAAVLPAVEINTSFYRQHRPQTYARWRDSVPASFRFAVKMPRTITHQKRLQHIDDELERFLAEVAELKQKLGYLLVQLPPGLQFDATIARTFFEKLRLKVNVPIACEPRHLTWFNAEADALLISFDVARVVADPPIQADVPMLPTLHVYIRLHGSPVIYHSQYTEQYLSRLFEQCTALITEGRQVWCVFDNTAEGAAMVNALSLVARDRTLRTLSERP